ncbi:MAG: hypothetical protein HC800_16630 [Phormidesmis sp. RL_2_1]|nr:hypothetical protein [Phormidesmis sp. RL_2_1]
MSVSIPALVWYANQFDSTTRAELKTQLRQTESAATVAPQIRPESSSEVVAVKTQSDALRDYKAGLSTIDGMSALISDIRPGLTEGEAELTVTAYFLAQPKAIREDLANSLWRAWVVSTGGESNVDRVRIRLVTSQGDKVGGSRTIAGSLIYVDD